MSKKLKPYKGIILLESMTALLVMVSLTTLVIPLLIQLKETEEKLNERWQNHRYLYETSRDKMNHSEITEQQYLENNQQVLVEIKENHAIISRLALTKDGKATESVVLLESN